MESGNTPGVSIVSSKMTLPLSSFAHDLDDWIDGLYGFVGVLHLHGKSTMPLSAANQPESTICNSAGVRGLLLGRGGIGSCSSTAA